MNNIELDSIDIKCDYCDYIDKNINQNKLDLYINKPCPKCSKNLLTLEDYTNQLIVFNTISLVNKLTMDLPDDSKTVKAVVSTHKNIKVKIND